eukprot:TRINITY_DN39300_c0_g1_i1.p1 TRINITY_DN39300_c0_g1~~TRINITY_DN39300_c0_g1_i1.p1  ORF type:complete len:260 (+),score=40.41 TRINITY_DN39300_c0_g1_i1:143-922(+)
MADMRERMTCRSSRSLLSSRAALVVTASCVLLLMSSMTKAEGNSNYGNHSPAAPVPPPPLLIHGANVTLRNLTIYDLHQGWADVSTNVYFKCSGERKVDLKNVKRTFTRYLYHGHELFQPVTTLPVTKCKYCGLFEEDTWSADDTYGEWTFCYENFTAGRTGLIEIHVPNQFRAIFECKECFELRGGGGGDAGVWIVLFWILIGFGVTVLLVGSVLAAAIVRKKTVDSAGEENSKFIELFDDEEADAGGPHHDDGNLHL